MHIIAKREPFPHIIINDLFTEEEYALIWKELSFITPKMLSPDKTSAASDFDGNLSKQGKGIFLRDFYLDKSVSDIQKITRKMFCKEIRDACNSLDLYFKQYKKLIHDDVLVQSYYNGDYYNEHDDYAVFTIVTLLHKKPKAYDGGELIFPEYNYNPNLQNNTSIIFPSIILHEVTEVKMQTYNREDGRYTISQLCQISPLNIETR